MKNEHNITENTAEAKETQRRYSSYDKRPNDNKRPSNRKTVIVTINHRRITDTLSEAKKRTEATRQREQSGTAERISRTAHPKHRQKLLSKHRRNRRTNSRINRRAEAPANVDVKVQPDSRSFRWADWNRSE